MDLVKLREVCSELAGPYSREAVTEAFVGKDAKCGVYAIMPQDCSWIYIGSSSSIPRRITEHRYLLQRGCHPKSQMQDDHRLDVDFVYYFQLCDSREEAYDLEQKVIDRFEGDPIFLNLAVDARSSWVMPDGYVSPLVGRARTEEVKQKLSDTVKAQFAAGRTSPMLGRSHTPEARKVLSDKARSRVVSNETRLKLSAQRQLGNHPRAKAVVINGVEYDCVSSAATALGLKYGTVYARICADSPEFSCWNFKTS